MDPVNTPMPKPSHAKDIIFAIIIIVIAIGAGYFIYNKASEEVDMTSTEQMEETTPKSSDSVTATLQTQSSSDDIDSIDADLKATDFSDIEK